MYLFPMPNLCCKSPTQSFQSELWTINCAICVRDFNLALLCSRYDLQNERHNLSIIEMVHLTIDLSHLNERKLTQICICHKWYLESSWHQMSLLISPLHLENKDSRSLVPPQAQDSGTPRDFYSIEMKIYHPNGFDKREKAFSVKYNHNLNMFIIKQNHLLIFVQYYFNNIEFQ